jgi:hypothetical protein
MFRIYDEKFYEHESKILAFNSGTEEANRHAATVCLTVILRLFDMLIPHLE